MRLQNRKMSWAEEARKEAKGQQLIAEEAKVELMHSKEDADRAISEAEEAKREADFLRQEAEKAIVKVEETKPKENPQKK